MAESVTSPSSLQGRVASNTPRRRGPKYTSAGYAGAINAYRTPGDIFSGAHFSTLSAFLLSGGSSSKARRRQNYEPPEHLITYVNFKSMDRYPSQHWRTVDEFTSYFDDNFWPQEPSSLLFLNGYLTPEWLNNIGAAFRIDPEFYRRHLYYMSTDAQGHYSAQTQLSSMVNMARFRITTLGIRMRKSGPNDQAVMDKLRKEVGEETERYHKGISWTTGSDCAAGDTVVRDFSVHDHEHFSIEQDLSIYVTRNSRENAVVVWSDIGNDLSRGPHGPWRTLATAGDTISLKYLPISQHRHKVALRSITPDSPWTRQQSTVAQAAWEENVILQNAALISRDYGKSLKSEIAMADPLYALQDVFSIAAAAEVQFLNMMDAVVNREQDSSATAERDNPKRLTISNFMYHRQVLRRHVVRLRENFEFIQAAKTRWRRPDDLEQKQEADLVADSICNDFRYLLDRARNLIAECERGMNIVMHHANIRESREAISQAERTAKLTQLAFFFIPLSFTTSFFGMNFKEISSGSTLSVWVWFAISLPVLLASFAFMAWDVTSLLRQWTQDLLARIPKDDKNEHEMS